MIEGMMGLFDSSSPVSDSGSTAELAKQLTHRLFWSSMEVQWLSRCRDGGGGYARFDPAVYVAGVLFNRVSSGGALQVAQNCGRA
ncbi:MAG: hypothetical protein U0236_07730 [Nitrospira sp.]